MRTIPNGAEHVRADALVDEGGFQMRNICGALLSESIAVLSALGSGLPLEDVRSRALGGTLFRQRSRETRRRFWHAIHARYLGHGVQWVIEALARAALRGPHDPTTLGLFYLHFALRDRLTREWITGPIWQRWCSMQWRVTREDVLADLDGALVDADVRWTEASLRKLATSLLSALRDFDLARGIQVKQLHRPVLNHEVVAHLLRILVERGVRGASLIDDPAWRLFFRSPDDVAGELQGLAQSRTIRFERAGSTVVLETPWSDA